MSLKAFNKWATDSIKVEDQGLVEYISLEPRIVPKTGARYIGNRFHKSKVFIIERLMNKLMIPGHKAKKHFKTSYHMTGKSTTSYKIMFDVLKQIEQKLSMNPIEVVAKAVENAAPREEIVSIEYGGARYPKAVECSPQRRVDLALRWLTQGSFHKRFNTKKSSSAGLAEELIAAYKLSPNSNAIAKKLELERQADASR